MRIELAEHPRDRSVIDGLVRLHRIGEILLDQIVDRREGPGAVVGRVLERTVGAHASRGEKTGRERAHGNERGYEKIVASLRRHPVTSTCSQVYQTYLRARLQGARSEIDQLTRALRACKADSWRTGLRSISPRRR